VENIVFYIENSPEVYVALLKLVPGGKHRVKIESAGLKTSNTHAHFYNILLDFTFYLKVAVSYRNGSFHSNPGAMIKC
jgi:hypothetical protein